MDPADIARVIGAGRVTIGAGLFALPKLTGSAWLGEPAKQPGGRLAVASLGARDMALGAGTLWALAGRRRAPRAWLLAAAAGDLADLVGVLRHREGLTSASAVGTAVMAGGAAAAGIWLARELD